MKAKSELHLLGFVLVLGVSMTASPVRAAGDTPEPGKKSTQYVVGQKNKQFTVDKLTIKKGETVSFENNDPFFHNVYSLSPIKSFDLGSYPQGEARDVVFEEEGTVEVECAIHPKMHMTIEVVTGDQKGESGKGEKEKSGSDQSGSDKAAKE